MGGASGTATAPVIDTPKSEGMKPSASGISSATRWPGPTPRSARCLAIELARDRSCS